MDGAKQIVYTGDIVKLPAGCKHTIVAETTLQVIEIQLGEEISIQDKKKFNF